MTEFDGIADNIAISLSRRDLPTTMAESLTIVRTFMLYDTETLISRVAESLMLRGQYK